MVSADTALNLKNTALSIFLWALESTGTPTSSKFS